MTSDQITVYGATWCKDCRRTKQFFSEHRVRYTWIDIQEQPEAVAFVEAVNHGNRSVPTIVFPDGDILVEPSNAELARKLGMQTRAQRTDYDVIIIGGGPAGLTAAIYTTREGLDTLVIEKSALGGQIAASQQVDNVPGFDAGISGELLADRLARQAQRFGAETLEAQAVETIARDGHGLTVYTTDGDAYTARAVLLATGGHYRRLQVPGEDALIGHSIHFCATCDGAFYTGKDVLVVGGGNSGFEESLFLARFVRSVQIVEFLPQVRASKILQQAVANEPNISVLTNHAVREFRRQQDGRVVATVEDRATGARHALEADGVFVFIGLSPNSAFLPPGIQRTRDGFVVTDATMMTSMPGVFAAGDLRDGSTKQITAAAGEAATAAMKIRDYIESLAEDQTLSLAQAAL